jgi:2-succinyl-5-enolpyruvyl-6-hydroxy-3-cyclohexene-1-carboxylate synthase
VSDPGADTAAVQADFAATLVDEWVRGGVTDAVVCPGSRSAPLALALAGHPGVRVHVRLDERSAGFFALGLALATGRPAVVCTTSGTAAAELHAAVLEAHHAHVPLLVCTADRPPELQQVGAPQTVDQHRLYGTATRWFASPGVPDRAVRTTWRPLAARALAEATSGPAGPGPVHLDLAFREPLHGAVGTAEPGRPGNAAATRILRRPPDGPLLTERWWGRRGLIVAGAGCGHSDGVLELARRTGWPVLADPRSRCRVSAGGDGPVVVAAADAIVRAAAAEGAGGVADALRPDAVLVLGAPPVSKAWAAFAADAVARGADVAVVDPWWSWHDPDRVVHEHVAADAAHWVVATLEHLDSLGHRPVDHGWSSTWARGEAAAQAAVDAALGADGGASEPAVARELLGAVPDGTRVVVSSSMPVRDLEWFAPSLHAPPALYANRGVNGIDGVCSTALGLAADGGGPVVALVGDLAFLHDVSALVRPAPNAGAPSPAPCTLVVLDNGGGAIFSFLPHAGAVAHERFEALFGTPQAVSVADVARGFGVPVAEVDSIASLREALAAEPASPVRVVRVAVPGRAANVAVHERVQRAVSEAVRTALGR